VAQGLVSFDNSFSLNEGDGLAGLLGFCSAVVGAQECDKLSHLSFLSCRNTCSSINANGPRSVPCSASKTRWLMSK